MAKQKTAFVCNDCGADHSKWQGQCSACGAWNTLTEIRLSSASSGSGGGGGARNARFEGYAGGASQDKVISLAEVNLAELPRFGTGTGELDRVLGGGLVPGSAILIGGHPGAARVRCCCRSCVIWQSRCLRSISPVKNRCSRWRCVLIGWGLRRIS